jgi:dephospho-CoA kinase
MFRTKFKESLMKRIITLLLLQISCVAFSASDARSHRAVFLKGTACAGKTSICNALQKRGWQVFEEDSFLIKQLIVHVQERFPQEFKLIKQAISGKNMAHAIVRNQILFKHAATLIERQRASQALDSVQMQLNQTTEENNRSMTAWVKFLQTSVLEEIEQHARKGNIVIDAWFLNAEHLQELQQRLGAETILVYAPLADLIQRTIKRNSEALIESRCITSMRFLRQPFIEFFNDYTLSTDAGNMLCALSKADFLHTCDIINLCLSSSGDTVQTQQLFTRSEFSKESFAAFCQPILQQFEDHGVLYVAPKKSYEHTIGTHSLTPDSAAEYIEKITN